jgi:4-aminobutyrate aminotransferase
MSDLIARQRAVIPNWVSVYYNEPIEIVSGKGCRVTDSQGHTYLDFFAGILTNMLGYDVAEVREAVERQLATGIQHTSTLYLIRSQVELAEKIAKLSGIPDAKVFFTNSGSEANETALTAALTARKANQVLAMRNSYHGRTFGTVAITGNAVWKATSNDPFGTHYLHGTDKTLPQFRNLSDAEYIDACVADLRALLQAAINPKDVGALIAEPIQGVGGFTMAPDGLFKAYKEVLDEHGILLISDEVQTGWGRTGEHFWGIQAHDVTPDFMTFAKGLANGFAIGGVVGRGDLLDGIRGNGISTFGGNPISTTAANATLDYVLSHDLQAATSSLPASRRPPTSSRPSPTCAARASCSPSTWPTPPPARPARSWPARRSRRPRSAACSSARAASKAPRYEWRRRSRSPRTRRAKACACW